MLTFKILVLKSINSASSLRLFKKARSETSEGGEDSCDPGQRELLYFKMVEGKIERGEDCLALFAGLFAEFELD